MFLAHFFGLLGDITHLHGLFDFQLFFLSGVFLQFLGLLLSLEFKNCLVFFPLFLSLIEPFSVKI
jgi:hypothetical protein